MDKSRLFETLEFMRILNTQSKMSKIFKVWAEIINIS